MIDDRAAAVEPARDDVDAVRDGVASDRDRAIAREGGPRRRRRRRGDFRCTKDGGVFFRQTISRCEFYVEVPIDLKSYVPSFFIEGLDNTDPLRLADRVAPFEQLILEREVRRRLPALANAVHRGNDWIASRRLRVRRIFITTGDRDAPTSFTLLAGTEPVVLIENRSYHVGPPAVANEMAHAIFHALRRAKEDTVRLLISDIFLRLRGTNEDLEYPRDEPQTHFPAGLLMVTPPFWLDAAKDYLKAVRRSGRTRPKPERTAIEHPWDHAEEFWSSAFEAYLTDKRALERSYRRFRRLDPAIKAPGRDLLDLFKALDPESGLTNKRRQGILKKLRRQLQQDDERASAAAAHLETIKPAGELDPATHEVIRLLLDPTGIEGCTL